MLHLTELADSVSHSDALDLYHTLGVVRISECVNFGFEPDDYDLSFDTALDAMNFRELNPGTVLGRTRHRMPLQMMDEAGRDVAGHYFLVSDGKLRLRKQAVPAMFTTGAT